MQRSAAPPRGATEARLALQHEVARVLAESSSKADAIPRVLEATCRLLDWDVGAYWPVEPGREEQRCEFIHASPGLEAFAAATLGHRVRVGVSFSGEIWASGEARWLADVGARADVPQAREAAALGVQTGFGFPALVGTEVVGIVEFFSREARVPDSALLDATGAIGRQVGQFVGRVRVERERAALLVAERRARAEAEAAAATLATLVEDERQSRAHLGLVAAASSVLGSSLDLDATLAGVARVAVGGFADLVALDLRDGGGDGIRRVAVEVGRPDLDGAIRAGLLANPPSIDDIGGPAEALRSGQEHLYLDCDQEEGLLERVTRGRPRALPHAQALRPRSLIYMPLIARGRTLGVLGLVRTERPFGERDVETARELAARAAIAVDNALLYGEAQRGRERLGFLAEASAVLGSSLDDDSTLEQMAQLAVGRVADWCVVHLREEWGLRLVTVASRDTERTARVRAAGSKVTLSDPGLPALVERVCATGEPQLVVSVPSEQLHGPFAEAGLRSVVIVPLTTRERILGTLSLAWAETDATYDEADLDFAADLARRVADAIDNARLFRAAEERAQAARVLASVGDGVFLVDRAGVVRSWNPAAVAATGLPEAEVLGRRASDVLPGWPDVAARVPVAAPGAIAPRPESLPLGLGDREVWLSIHGVPVSDGVVYAFRDLTEDRALEEMRTEFVSTVSHELRTPLAAIYGAAMTLRRSDVVLDDTQRAGLLAVVGNEADRLARTVNDILWASRLDSDTLHVAVENCDARALAAEVVAAQHAHLPEGIDLTLEDSDELPPFAADADKVRQVLVNLVENAVKYSPDGGRVDVRIAAVGARLRFSVADNGLGIPAAEQRRIFEKFYRLDPNMTRGIGGTGLGLYICRELLRRMNGRLWVESQPGQGSTFSFELPVAGTDPDVAAHLAHLAR